MKPKRLEIFTHKAQAIDGGQWVYGGYLSFYPNTESPLDPPPNIDEYKHYIVHPQDTDWGLPKVFIHTEVKTGTICPFTEQFDSNGNPIYAFDILKFKCHKLPCTVVKRHGIYYGEFEINGVPEHIQLSDISDGCVIIGNILEGI
jgi:hypothetical protein